MEKIKLINIFPEAITSRFNYNGKSFTKTGFGTWCTCLYVLIMLGITTYYAVPILYRENPKIKENSLVTPMDSAILYEDGGPFAFYIGSVRRLI